MSTSLSSWLNIREEKEKHANSQDQHHEIVERLTAHQFAVLKLRLLLQTRVGKILNRHGGSNWLFAHLLVMLSQSWLIDEVVEHCGRSWSRWMVDIS